MADAKLGTWSLQIVEGSTIRGVSVVVRLARTEYADAMNRHPMPYNGIC
jgi:hypothetical protein